MRETTEPPLQVAYLCLQPGRPGQAAFTHVDGIASALRNRGWGVQIFRPPTSVFQMKLFGRLRAAWRVQRQMIRACSEVDALYVRLHPAALPSVRWARRSSKTIVVEVNGPAEDWLIAWPGLGRLRRLLLWLLREQLSAAHAILPVTHGLARWAREQVGAGPLIEVVPNAVDPEKFHPGARMNGRALPSEYAVFVGELAPWQGIEDLLEAAIHPSWPPRLALVIAGDGALREQVQEAARRQPGRVLALGPLDHHAVPGLVAGAVVALVSSRDRAGTGIAPLKLFEALACGVPVVASRVDDISAYTTGPLVDPGDVAGWAQAVASIESDRQASRRLGDIGRGDVLSKHSWQIRGTAIAKVLACAS